jgi:hypothetical protein
VAYTPTPIRPKLAQDNFGGLRTDGNRVAMTGALGNTVQSQDAAVSPVTSPVTNMNGSGVNLVVPTNAVQFTINSTVAVQVGEDTSFAQGLNIPANTLYTMDCGNMTNIAVKPSSGTNTTSFQFKLV